MGTPKHNTPLPPKKNRTDKSYNTLTYPALADGQRTNKQKERKPPPLKYYDTLTYPALADDQRTRSQIHNFQ